MVKQGCRIICLRSSPPTVEPKILPIVVTYNGAGYGFCQAQILHF